MSLQIGDTVPDFVAQSTAGTIRFHEWIGDHWAVLFSHPADYTPVCTTELGEVSRRRGEFERRGVKVIGVSVDPLEDHRGWVEDIREVEGVDVDFPLLADPDRRIATLYGMIHPKADPKLTVRTVFVIDSRKTLRLSYTYPPSIGRNFDELLRAIDALQLSDRHRVATPVNWRPGDAVIIPPAVPDEEARSLFPQGWTAKRPYLRVVSL